jgi:malate permease and related proteins
MTAYFTIILLIAAGYLLARGDLFPAATPAVLNRVVITLCLPALILIHVPSLEPSWSLLPLVLIPWLLLAGTIGVILPLSRVLKLSREVTASLLVLIPLGNTSFLGFPLIEALLGPEFLPLAVVYDQFGSFLIVCTHVLFVIGWYGDGDNPSLRSMTRQVISFPPFVALILALALGNAWFPEWLMGLTHRFADMLLPLVTLAIGMSLKLRLVPDYRLGLMIGLFGKLMMLPALALLLAWLMNAESSIATVAVLESAMPPMITAAALLASARLAPALGSALVAWGVLLSALTVPMWHGISQWVFGLQ